MTASLPSGASQSRVLFADDEESLRTLVSRILGRLGYEVVAVKDGAQALTAYREAPRDWDLVLLDIVMPVMSGVIAYEGIRTHDPDTRVLFCSGYHAESIEHLLKSDARLQFLPKPFDIPSLEGALASLGLSSARRGDDAS